jgi:hypothetical protein
MRTLFALMLGNSAILCSAAILIVLERLDGAAMLGAAVTGVVVGVVADIMMARANDRA